VPLASNHKPVTQSRSALIIKSGLVLLWLVLLGMLLQRDFFVRELDTHEALALERDRRVEYQSIYFKNEKIGYVENQFIPEGDDTLRVRQKAVMNLTISGQTHLVELDLDAHLGAGSNLTDFSFSFASPFYRMHAEGAVTGNDVSFTLDTGNSVIEDRVTLPGPPRLSTSRRSYLLGQNIEAGEKVKIPWFDPFSLSGKESVIEYRGKEKVLINDRVFNLHRFTENFGGARLNSWLDDDGSVVKEESPAGFVFVKEPEFKARAFASGDEPPTDLLASVAVQIIGDMIDVSGLSSASYRLSLPEDVAFDLDTGRQQFDGEILTLNRETYNPDTGTALCADRKDALLASPYVQSGAPEIISRSQEIIDGLPAGGARVKALADWVYQHLEKRPVIGIPDAVTTLQSGIGDCNDTRRCSPRWHGPPESQPR